MSLQTNEAMEVFLTTLLLMTTIVVSSSSSSAPLATAPSPSATTTTPTPSSNLTTLMTRKSCKTFAALILSIPDVLNTFSSDVDGGLTIFCPTDRSLGSFLPVYKNLSSEAKASFLLYHGIPLYNSINMFKDSNGEFNTLATDGTTKNYNFTVQNAGDAVTIETGVVTATIVATVVDKQPLAIYAVDEVLQPRELFKTAESPAPAPAPEAKQVKEASPPAPDAPEAAPADKIHAAYKTSAGDAVIFGGLWSVAATMTVAVTVGSWLSGI